MRSFTQGAKLMIESERIDTAVSHLTSKDDLDQGSSHLNYLGKGLLPILDALPFYVLLIDRNHRILLANKATRDALGVEASKLVGDYCPQAVHGQQHGSYPGCPLEQAVISKQAVEIEHFDEKTCRWLKIAVYPTSAWSIDGQGIYLHMIQDITAQKDAEMLE